MMTNTSILQKWAKLNISDILFYGECGLYRKMGKKSSLGGKRKKGTQRKSQTLSMAEKGIWAKEKHIITSLGKMIISTCKGHIRDFSNVSALT